MKTGSRFFWVFSILLGAAASCVGLASGAENVEKAGAENGKIARVVLIGVDGGGAFFKDAETPNLDQIFQNGAITYEAITAKPTISAQCWGSMLHGVTPEMHGLTNSIVSEKPFPTDSEFPSVFRIIRENDPNARLASFCNWNPINVGIVEDGLGVVKGTARGDEAVTDLVCDYLEKNDPTFLFVQYDDCDGAGHRLGYGTAGHLEQIKTTDGYVRRIYDVCAKRGFLDSTLFIVTADHGGFEKGHGGWTDGEKKIMIAATGPNVVKGTIGEVAVRDLSSIALYALGLADKQPESWTSRVPSGFFEGVEASERPVYAIRYAFEHRTHTPKPTPTGDAAIPAILGADRVRAYFPFDGDVKDALGKVETAKNGKLYFVDGYFGRGATFDDGFVSIPDFGLAANKSSFSAAFWLKTGGVEADPAIFSNKDWRNGTLSGFVLSLRGSADVKFNVGDAGKGRFDREYALPRDYVDGWVYVVFVVDRAKSEVRFSFDFGAFDVAPLPAEFADVDFENGLPLNIGQDGTGKYRVGLGAELDELIFVDGALTDKDVAALKKAYLGE